MDILFLHTLSSNTELFAPSASKALPRHQLHHDVQEHFLSTIREHGPTADITREIHTYLKDKLNRGHDYIVCTCSTLGPIVDSYPDQNVFRVDRPMAQECANYQRALVAVTLESTVEPTKALLQHFAPNTQLSFLFIDGAWEHYTNQDTAAFNQCISDAIAQHLTDSAVAFDAIVLAQASMSTASTMVSNTINTFATNQHIKKVTVLNSPDSCLHFIVSLLEHE